MHESWHTNYNNIKEEIERFEQMENGHKNHFFDVHTIENIFDFFSDKFQFEKAERVLQIGIHQHPYATSLKIKQAIVLIEKGEDQEAIHLLEELQNLEKSNPEVYLNLGLVYLRNNRINDAIICFNNALESAFEDRDEILLDIAINLNQEEAFVHTISFLEQEINNYPDSESLLFELAYAYDKEYNLDKGLETYLKVIDINPFSENAWYNLGILHIKNSDYEAANNCYDYTLALNPRHGEALFNKANNMVNLDRCQEAIDIYIDYISYGYEEILPYHYIADCYERIGDIEMALRFYRLATKTDPAYMPVWLNYLACLINHQFKKESVKAGKLAIKHHPDFGEFWYLYGRALLLNKMYDEAYKAFEEAVEDDPESLRNFYEIYQLILVETPAKQRVRQLQAWLKKYPDSPAVHFILATYYIKDSRNVKKAAMHFEKAMQNDPGSYDLLIDLMPELDGPIDRSPALRSILYKYLIHDDGPF
ncbi:tetratricopeptide repeat protein [Natronoflexus pectinivorans]|uniref:Tetratricopeptide repeat protein n=1 Tax=Natronoflexus pectinivorans TaxID=682526 RepID=A0A4R2GLF9_9BACT|nr:tetratricopeptide repeat protein [Natronoflexus pectinivorans]TCO09148.1 tetratricopeptide repeat protein [Natronoflexus pectinivorans]